MSGFRRALCSAFPDFFAFGCGVSRLRSVFSPAPAPGQGQGHAHAYSTPHGHIRYDFYVLHTTPHAPELCPVPTCHDRHVRGWPAPRRLVWPLAGPLWAPEASPAAGVCVTTRVPLSLLCYVRKFRWGGLLPPPPRFAKLSEASPGCAKPRPRLASCTGRYACVAGARAGHI